MNAAENETSPSLDKIIGLAQQNSDAGWAEIDEQLPVVCDQPEFVAWAKLNTANQESALRDLAATILGATAEELETEDVDKLVALMRADDPANPYPRFRAACALAKKRGVINLPLVQAEVAITLREFVDDPAVADIARQQLESL
jgi:hypothetical protein